MKAGRSKMLKLARVPVDIGGQFIFRSFEVNQIWQSLVFLPHLLIFAVPGVLRNYPSRGGCACCRKQAGCISVNGVTLSHRDANSSNSTRKYLHTCIDCHRSGHSDCSYCGHATPSGIILWIVKVATFVLDLLMVSQKISLSHWKVLTECMVASVTKLSAR